MLRTMAIGSAISVGELHVEEARVVGCAVAVDAAQQALDRGRQAAAHHERVRMIEVVAHAVAGQAGQRNRCGDGVAMGLDDGRVGKYREQRPQLLHVAGRLQHPSAAAAQPLQGLQHPAEIAIAGGVILARVVAHIGRHGERELEAHRTEAQRQQAEFFVGRLGLHLVHAHQFRRRLVQGAPGPVRPARCGGRVAAAALRCRRAAADS